ncbi:MAG: hypothetical protein IM674_03915 [Brevundimonas sp.]|nr:hypothetical protein [Brevundimonas sp.]
MRTALVATAILMAASSVGAQEADHDRLNELPLEQAYAEMVRLEGGREQGFSVGLLFYSARLALANLGYAIDLRSLTAPLTDPDTQAAVREFEGKAGLVADGSLTFGELERLMTLSRLAQLTPLSVGSGKHVAAYEGALPAVRASGTWSMADIAFPLNYSEIRCQIDEQTCEERIIWVSAPTLTGSNADLSSYVITTHTDFYEIESWENGVLDAKATNSCRQVRLSINTRTELVTQTTQDLDPEGCAIPNSELRLPPIDGLRVATLIDPWDARSTHFDTIRAATNGVRGQALGVLFPSE